MKTKATNTKAPHKSVPPDVLKAWRQKHGKKYDYSKVRFVSKGAHVNILCPTHGVFSQTPANHVNYGCNECAKEQRAATRRATMAKSVEKRRQQSIEKAPKLHANKYDYSKAVFASTRDKATIICPEHGEWVSTFASHLQGHGCPKCAAHTIAKANSNGAAALRNNFVKNAKKVHGDYYDYSKVDYTGKTARDKVTIIHPVLGEFEQTYGNHVTLKHHHPKHHLTVGRQDYVKAKLKEFLRGARENHGSEYSYPNLSLEFDNPFSKITVVCPEHGPFKQFAHNHRNGNGCRLCKRSSLEKAVDRWLQTIKPGDMQFNDRKVLKGKELDILLPEKKFALELGGVYWHGGPSVPPSYHLEKLKGCLDAGLSLMTIFDCEWHTKSLRLILKSRIRAKLGLSKTYVGARKCKIVSVSSKDAKKFLEANHLKGYSVCRLSYGLEYENKLISIISMGRPRYDKKYSWEIIRVCNKRGYNIPGAFSRLFKHFVENNDTGKGVVTYSDRRFGEGNVYSGCGFVRLADSAPTKWLTHVGGRGKLYHWAHTLPNNIEKILKVYDPNETLEYNLGANNFTWIYDCGCCVYEWKKPA